MRYSSTAAVQTLGCEPQELDTRSRTATSDTLIYQTWYTTCDQAFDYARSRAGDVTELFDILAAKLRPGSKDPSGGEIGEGGKTFSGKSTLQAHYHGSSGSTVLSTANLKRIQTFLDEPQKHLGQVRIPSTHDTYSNRTYVRAVKR